MRKDNEKNSIRTAYIIIILIAASIFIIRLLTNVQVHNTALLYVWLPFSLSLALYFFTPHKEEDDWKSVFWNNLRQTLIIMFASSIILMDGYICVIMFLPIYILMVIVSFISKYLYQRFYDSTLKSITLPALVLALSMEGVIDQTSFNRENHVTHIAIIEDDIETVRNRFHNSVKLNSERHWILSIFPLPTNISSGSLNEGDIHTLDFTYHRWFSTNTHEGQMKVTLDEVSDTIIRTSIQDTSYIANYMKFKGTELSFEEIADGKTKVSLTVSYDRLLDPVWYFGPLQRFAVDKSAEYLINEIANRKEY